MDEYSEGLSVAGYKRVRATTMKTVSADAPICEPDEVKKTVLRHLQPTTLITSIT